MRRNAAKRRAEMQNMNKKRYEDIGKNKVIVITGASSGIGEAMAKVYAAQGAKVVLGARNVQKLQLLAGDIRARGGQAALTAGWT